MNKGLRYPADPPSVEEIVGGIEGAGNRPEARSRGRDGGHDRTPARSCTEPPVMVLRFTVPNPAAARQLSSDRGLGQVRG